MSNTLLVATDLSVNSKAGIRFAFQWAKQARHSLVFFHCLQDLRPTRWTDARYDAHKQSEAARAENALQKLVQSVLRSSRGSKIKYTCVVRHATDVQDAIVEEAQSTGAAAICMSTRGGGRLKKLIGAHTSGIIHTSPVSVFVVPSDYRRNPIAQILYATDLNRLAPELKLVRDLARPLKAKVLVLHYDYLADVEEAREKLGRVTKQFRYPNVKFKFQKYNVDRSLARHLQADIRASRASLAVLFTNQKRGWFDRLFLSSKSADLAYESRVPLLIIPKE
jgi:nucleotide-binding universal stress UspA family protein